MHNKCIQDSSFRYIEYQLFGLCQERKFQWCQEQEQKTYLHQRIMHFCMERKTHWTNKNNFDDNKIMSTIAYSKELNNLNWSANNIYLWIIKPREPFGSKMNVLWKNLFPNTYIQSWILNRTKRAGIQCTHRG